MVANAIRVVKKHTIYGSCLDNLFMLGASSAGKQSPWPFSRITVGFSWMQRSPRLKVTGRSGLAEAPNFFIGSNHRLPPLNAKTDLGIGFWKWNVSMKKQHMGMKKHEQDYDFIERFDYFLFRRILVIPLYG